MGVRLGVCVCVCLNRYISSQITKHLYIYVTIVKAGNCLMKSST